MSSVEFGDLFHFIRNGMNVKQDKSGDGLPITRIETIADASVDGLRVGYANLKEEDCRNWLMAPGDILFSHINSVEHVGKCAVYRGDPEKLIHGMNLLCLRCDTTKLFPEFAKYLIRGAAFRTRLASFINKAVNQASVSIGNLRTIPVAVPSLPEQRRIAEVLDRADALRAKRRAALAQLGSLTQSIFLAMFGDPATNPRVWPTRSLGEVALDPANNGVFRKNDEYANDDASGLPVVWVVELFRGDFIETGMSRRLVATDSEIAKFGLHCGDLLFCRSSLKLDGIAFNSVYLGESDTALFECHLIRLRPNVEIASPRYLNSLLRLPEMRAIAKSKAKTATMTTIDQKSLCSIPVMLPPVVLQETFADRLAAIDKLKATHHTALTELDLLFASLQHRAFRGEL